MPEHQQTQKSTESKTTSQKQATPRIQTPVSHPMAIIQRARINPKSLTHADVMQLQRTIGNRAVVRLLSEIGAIPSKAKQAPPVQRQELVQRQEIPEEEEPLQGKFESGLEKEICPSCMQRQEIPEEEEPLQGKMIGTIQRQEIPEEEEPLQGKFENNPSQMVCHSCFAAPIVQRQEMPEEEEPLQGKMIDTVQRQEIPEEEEPLQTKRENNTGMPDNLKAGVENLSGIDMSNVRVHYNSSKPAEVGALAYTQGINIHVAPGQERHLSHEAWHVVQQSQGRVQPTMQLKGVAVNDDIELENEAYVMGVKALNQITQARKLINHSNHVKNVIQGAFDVHFDIRPTPLLTPVDNTWTVEDIFADGSRPDIGAYTQHYLDIRQPNRGTQSGDPQDLRHVIAWERLKQDTANLAHNTLLQVATHIDNNWPATSAFANPGLASVNTNDKFEVERYAKSWTVARHDDPKNLFYGNRAENQASGAAGVLYDNPTHAKGPNAGGAGTAFTPDERKRMISDQLTGLGITLGNNNHTPAERAHLYNWLTNHSTLPPVDINFAITRKKYKVLLTYLSNLSKFPHLTLTQVFNY